jgi:glucokinase
VVARVADLAREVCARFAGISSIGIGVPGLFDRETGNMRMLPNLPGEWEGVPMASVVSSSSGLPTHVINDARAFGLAELRLGAGRGASSMVGITLGTGVGGVICVDGRVHFGHDGTAGELGHQTIDRDGPDCTCGANGCLEAMVRADRIAALCGTATAAEAVERASAGEPRALAGLAEVGSALGVGIANMITLITPDVVVVGGGVAGAFDLLESAVSEQVRRRVTTTSLDQVRIVTAELGIWAGAIGAAVHGAETAGVAAS